VEDVFDIPIILEEELLKNNLLEWLNEEIDHAYLEQLLEMSKMEQAERERKKDLKIVYTPLHGTGGVIVPKGLQQINFQYIDCVEEQKAPVPEFRTVFSPDPGEDQAFTRAIKLGEQKNADILLATDPNADRLG